MAIRRRSLPSGWYPATASGVRARCEEWESGLPAVAQRYSSIIVPHAGWAFSGRLAYKALRAMPESAETVVVVGGHLRPSDPVLAAPEVGFETPFGHLEADSDLLSSLSRRFDVREDHATDNTVEVQLPLVHHLAPHARIAALRCPPAPCAEEVGRFIAEFAAERERLIFVVGSTDLTHYGPAYGFVSDQAGGDPSLWVREKNDRPIVDAMVRLDADLVIRLALERHAACSSGAAAAAIGYAVRRGSRRGELIEYAQSSDVRPDASFVGYAAIGFPRADAGTTSQENAASMSEPVQREARATSSSAGASGSRDLRAMSGGRSARAASETAGTPASRDRSRLSRS